MGTKLMVSTNRDSALFEKSVNVDNRYNFKVVDEFIYLGSAVNGNNNVSLEIKRKIVLYPETDAMKQILLTRLGWFGPVTRMDKDEPAR